MDMSDYIDQQGRTRGGDPRNPSRFSNDRTPSETTLAQTEPLSVEELGSVRRFIRQQWLVKVNPAGMAEFFKDCDMTEVIDTFRAQEFDLDANKEAIFEVISRKLTGESLPPMEEDPDRRAADDLRWDFHEACEKAAPVIAKAPGVLDVNEVAIVEGVVADHWLVGTSLTIDTAKFAELVAADPDEIIDTCRGVGFNDTAGREAIFNTISRKLTGRPLATWSEDPQGVFVAQLKKDFIAEYTH